MTGRLLTIVVNESHAVSGLLVMPVKPMACLVLAHGAGAGMTHPFLESFAEGLGVRQVATLRFQFPYMEAGTKRPDRPPLAHATVRAAVASAVQNAPDLPLFAGGKSFGGRMTSQAQAEEVLPGVRGLVFLGFPLHPAGKPSIDRADHLLSVEIPMLFLQGTRDALADISLISAVTTGLGERASIPIIDDADHSFHVRAKSGRRDADVMAEMLDRVAQWISMTLAV